jgi:maltose/moltooligosaccharide transporter
LMARWMSWFRMVSTGAAAFYNFFVFQYAESHAFEIFTGGAILYLVGFGLMCWKVKEGEYPPPPANIDGKEGVWSAVKTYGVECHQYFHYILVFLIGVCFGGGYGATPPFLLFFYQSCGLSLAQIGTVQGIYLVSFSLFTLLSGWLADRYHPLRILLIGILWQVVFALPLQCVWLFADISPTVSYYLWIGISIAMSGPAAAFMGLLDVPLFVRIFPQDRFGQFCSANAMWRSVSLGVSGVLIGWYFDLLGSHVGEKKAYMWLPIWQWAFTIIMLLVVWRLYRSWKRYGGDESYVPPGTTLLSKR